MIPKKLKSFYPILAQQLNVPVEVVEVLYDTLFEYLANKVRNLEGKDIYLKNIGTFTARKSKIEKLERRINNHIAFMDKMLELEKVSIEDFNTTVDMLKKYLERLYKLKADIHEEWLRKQENKKLRNEYISRGLEEQKADNGGHSE